MGHRRYFYLLEKETINEIRNLTKKDFYRWAEGKGLNNEVDDDEPYIPLYKIGEEIFCLGNYYENTEPIKNTGKPLFIDKDLAQRYDEYEPFIVGKEALLLTIEHQQDLIIQHYEDMLFLTDEEREYKNFDLRSKEEMYKQYIENMYGQWKNKMNRCFAVNLDERNPRVSTSLRIEYSIFELVRLYKTIDWEKYDLLFLGW